MCVLRKKKRIKKDKALEALKKTHTKVCVVWIRKQCDLHCLIVEML